jgi:hypothetical protein
VVQGLDVPVASYLDGEQATNYVAMVSRLTPEDVAELDAAGRRRDGESMDAASAMTVLTTERLLTAESIRRPRIVLVASDFPASVTSAVVWLNEQGVDISLIGTVLPAGRRSAGGVLQQAVPYPVPDVEEFTIGRRPDATAPMEAQPAIPWDEASLQRLAAQANPATLALLDLCAAEEASSVSVKDEAEQAGITEAGVRGQLAGLTMRLKNPRYGFAQTSWPVTNTWLPGGFASYRMYRALAATWRGIRQETATPPPDAQLPK